MRCKRMARGTLILFVAVSVIAPAASALDRQADPVVMTGNQLGALNGIAPGQLVAFRWDGEWVQIPIQVDERAVIDFTQVYNGNTTYGSMSRLDYVDSNTFAGPDPNPTIDADDEIVFMARDLGSECPPGTALPPGTYADGAQEVAISDPLDGFLGYVYLFEQSGLLDPSAGVQYVTYNFNLLSGNYKTTYHIGGGGNPEDSSITTANYVRHFSDRWISDAIQILDGTPASIDILDRHKNLFAPNVCGRSEDSFSSGEGAFIANKSGPVRAIRDYVGANSGPRTQRCNIFYDTREDIITHLRVHSITGIMDFFDYSSDATGMTYLNSNMTGPVTIDGVPDTVTAGEPEWELVTGLQGSIVIIPLFVTNLPGLTFTNYYLDDVAPPVEQCTGDAFAYGASGVWIQGTLQNTDPVIGQAYMMEAIRTVFYGAPGISASQAQDLRDMVDNPLTVSCHQWPAGQEQMRAANGASLFLLMVMVCTCALIFLYSSPRAPRYEYRGQLR